MIFQAEEQKEEGICVQISRGNKITSWGKRRIRAQVRKVTPLGLGMSLSGRVHV